MVLFCDFTGVYGREGLAGYGDFIDFRQLSGTGMQGLPKKAELMDTESVSLITETTTI